MNIERKFWRTLLIYAAGMILSFMFFSCDAQKQLTRIIDKNPHLVKDTFLIHYDTTFINIPSVKKDSVVHIKSFMTDTIYLQKDRLSVMTYVYNDSVYIQGECQEIIDTVFSVERIPYKQIVYPEENFEWKQWLILCVVLAIVLLQLHKRNSS